MANQAAFEPDSDVHVTLDDQKKINKFARLNAQLEDLKEKIKIKSNEMSNFDEAWDELELWDDEDQMIPYLVGEVFVYQSFEKTKECVKEDLSLLKAELGNLQTASEKIKEQMSDLKTHLYVRFGSHINLENQE